MIRPQTQVALQGDLALCQAPVGLARVSCAVRLHDAGACPHAPHTFPTYLIRGARWPPPFPPKQPVGRSGEPPTLVAPPLRDHAALPGPKHLLEAARMTPAAHTWLPGPPAAAACWLSPPPCRPAAVPHAPARRLLPQAAAASWTPHLQRPWPTGWQVGHFCDINATIWAHSRPAAPSRPCLLPQSLLPPLNLFADYEVSIAPVKRQLFGELLSRLASRSASSSSSASGAAAEPAQLLELGVGTGPNLRFYAEHYHAADADAGSAAAAEPAAAAAAAASPRPLPLLHITGIDRNDYMRPYLQQNLAASGWPEERFTWVAGDVAALPLQDASMDAVVCTLVSSGLVVWKSEETAGLRTTCGGLFCSSIWAACRTVTMPLELQGSTSSNCLRSCSLTGHSPAAASASHIATVCAVC